MKSTPDSIAQKEMGHRLRIIREALGIKQKDMADVAGVGMTTVGGWEGGRNQIDLVKMARLAKIFGFSIDWIALGDMSGLRFDLAIEVQRIVRATMGESLIRRGRPTARSVPRGDVPTVREVTDDGAAPTGSTLHEATSRYGQIK